MIVIAGILAGALTGGLIARKRGGKRADILHHATIYAIAFCLLAVFLTIAIDRLSR
jgi:hypothetical protein